MNGVAEGRSSVAWGFRSLREWRLILVLVATTVLLALPPALALWPALDSVFRQTLAGDHVLRNHPFFAPADVLEFLQQKRDVIAAARQTAVGGGVLAVLLQILFAGGFVEVLGRHDRAVLGPFVSGAFSNFWHNLKCFAIFAVTAAAVLGLWLGATGAASGKIFEHSPPGAPGPRIFRIGMLFVALLLFAVLSLLHDFARIARRFEPAAGAWRGYGMARRTLSAAWLRALGVLLFWFFLGGTAWLSLVAFEWATAAVSALAILLHTLLQIAAVIVRSAVRVAAWGSYVALADRRAPSDEPIPVESAPRAAAPLPDEPLSAPELIGDAPLT